MCFGSATSRSDLFAFQIPGLCLRYDSDVLLIVLTLLLYSAFSDDARNVAKTRLRNLSQTEANMSKLHPNESRIGSFQPDIDSGWGFVLLDFTGGNIYWVMIVYPLLRALGLGYKGKFNTFILALSKFETQKCRLWYFLLKFSGSWQIMAEGLGVPGNMLKYLKVTTGAKQEYRTCCIML